MAYIYPSYPLPQPALWLPLSLPWKPPLPLSVLISWLHHLWSFPIYVLFLNLRCCGITSWSPISHCLSPEVFGLQGTLSCLFELGFSLFSITLMKSSFHLARWISQYSKLCFPWVKQCFVTPNPHYIQAHSDYCQVSRWFFFHSWTIPYHKVGVCFFSLVRYIDYFCNYSIFFTLLFLFLFLPVASATTIISEHLPNCMEPNPQASHEPIPLLISRWD